MLSVGDWVTDKHGKTGYIVSVHENNYYVKFVNNRYGTSLRFHSFVASTEVEYAPFEFTPDEDDLYFLINLALDTNDKDWFNELTSKLPV